MDTKQIKERINRMMREETVTPSQAVELMASVMSLIEVRALADDLTVAVVDKALSEIGEGKLPSDKAVALFDELRAMTEKKEAAKTSTGGQEEPSPSGKKTYAGEDLGGMIRDVTGEALEYARDQIEIARDKLEKHGEKARRKMNEKGAGRIDGDVVQDHYTVKAHTTISGDLKTKTTSVHGVLALGGDLCAEDSLHINGKLECGGDVVSGETRVHGTGNCGDLKCGDLSVLGRLHCDGDLKSGDIMARGTVDCGGDAVGEDMSVSGKFMADGDIRSKDLQVSGRLNCTGDLRGDAVTGSGVIHCGGDLNAQELTVSGKTEGGGDVHALAVKVSGRLSSGGDMAATDLRLTGKISCGGDLKCDTAHVTGRMVGKGDMRFGALTVEEPHEWMEWLTGGRIKDIDQIECKGDLIVADEIQARGRIVVGGKASFQKGAIKYLSAQSVSLGPGVKAKRVEYRSELVLAEGAEVDEPVQVS